MRLTLFFLLLVNICFGQATFHSLLSDASGDCDREIVSVAALPNDTVFYGQDFFSIDLPTQVEVTLDDASTELLDIVWVHGSYDSLTLGNYATVGTLQLIPCVANTANEDAAITIVVIDGTIEFVEAQTPVEVAYSTEVGSLGLPTTVSAFVFGSGYEITVNVTWDTGDYDQFASGDEDVIYFFDGTLSSLPSGTNNDNSVTALIQLTLLAYDDSAIAQAFALYQDKGTEQSGTTSVSVPWPTHVANDVGFIFVESFPDDAAPTASAGWTEVPGSPQSETATSVRTRLSVFYRRAASAAEGDATISVASGNHIHAVMITYRGNRRIESSIDNVVFTTKSTQTTSLSIAGTTANQNGCDVLYATARGNDGAGDTYSSEANASLTGLTERHSSGTTTGNGGGLAIWTGNLASAGASGTLTATISTSVVEAYVVITFLGTNNYSAPTVQVSNLTLDGDREINFTKGNNARTLVLYNPNGAVDEVPDDETEYNVGDELGTDNFVIYNGTGSTAIHSEPFPYNQTIHVRAFGYNNSATGPLYNVTTATDNPISPTTITQDERILYDEPIVVSSKLNTANIHSSKEVYAVAGFEDADTYYLYWASDGPSPNDRDLVFLSTFDKTSALDIENPANWVVYDDDANGQPDSVFYNNTLGEWDNLRVLHSIVDMGGGSYRGYYSGASASAPQAIGYATSTDLINWTIVTTAAPILSGSDSHLRVTVFKDGADWHLLSSAASGTEGRRYRLRHYTSSDGLAWTLQSTDILLGTEVDGFFTGSYPVKISGRWHFLVNMDETDEDGTGYKASETKNQLYIGGRQIVEVSTPDFTVGSIRYEKVIYSSSRYSEYGVTPCTAPNLTYDGREISFINAYKWTVNTSLPAHGEPDINIKVLVDGANLSGTQVLEDSYPDFIHRIYHPTFKDQVTPIEVLTQTAGTVVGSPTNAYLNMIQAVDNGFVTYSSTGIMPDATDFAVILKVDNVRTATEQGFASVTSDSGTRSWHIKLDNTGKFEVRVDGGGGLYKLYTATIGGFTTALNTTVHFGFTWRSGVLNLVYDCTMDIPVTIVQNDSFTSIQSSSEPLRIGAIYPTTTNEIPAVDPVGTVVIFAPGTTDEQILKYEF